ncbi:phage tail tape measure protein [Neorhizobium galegae]|uniref:TP901 family phage tail tape measure protein n=1 Tax=Neorhizobium galegae bv. officinalis TaxID=323656 RepID=A0A0T7H0K3_NEOGA|nr:phage tail tape measure protein [Neorhizobium galegae]CDZ53071.1 TP901 family phage tail tape measure protein [Neorhizobium galegae bv. officinalis]
MSTHESRLKITLLDQVSSRARGISAALGGIERQASSFIAPFRSLGGQVLAFGGAYLGVSEGIKNTAGAAIDFETAFADVRKVVDANEEQFENLRRTIRQMSTELPIAANDIAALFAAAGESGIATADLKAFSEMAARVGIAFDMSAGEAGESLAKLKTQLGLTVAETGDMADAINHLSNNMASKAKDVTAYMLRVGALAEMGGFTKEQIAGIGSAMIAAGAEAETAGTAMQNVVKALTRGASAKKSQKEVAEALGLNLPQIAKEMQKDAPKALRKVLTAIAKTPKDRHLALLSDFFGDEAKAFAPLIGNMGLLEQALDSVSDRTKYSGSAFKEYVQRADTTANALDLIQNKIANRFWQMGDQMLPTIKEAALGMGYVLDTLDSRVSVFDEMEVAIKGFAAGLGYGGIREVIEELGDLFFGKIDPNAGDQLGRIFMQAKDWGASIRELNAALKENPIAQFFADIAPYGLQILAWGAGIAFLAGTVRKLAGALMLLSGASTLIGIFKVAKQLSGLLAAPAAATAATGGASAAAAGGGAAAGLMGRNLFKVLGWTGRNLLGPLGTALAAYEAYNYVDSQMPKEPTLPGVSAQQAMDAARGARAAGIGGSTTETLPGKTADDLGIGAALQSLGSLSNQFGPESMQGGGSSLPVNPIKLDAETINSLGAPRGVQQVEVMNRPPPPNVTVQAHFTINGVSDPEKIANDVSQRIGVRLREELAGIYADTGYGVA